MTRKGEQLSDEASDGGDYEVGYCKPPRHSRFKPGQSGNPAGRAKGTKNLASVLERELRAIVTIAENGRRRRVTKLDAAVKQLVNKAASGDGGSLQFLFRLLQSSQPESASVATLSSEIDEQVKRDLLRQIRSLPAEESDGSA